MKVAVVGATGLVGRIMLEVLQEREFPVDELIVAASPRSAGTKLPFRGQEVVVISVEEAISKMPDIALFSAGSDISLKYAPQFADAGAVVIDNSSAWRMDPEKPLIIPEVNGHLLTPMDKIIANPNCSTIQLLAAVAPIHRVYGIERMIVSTYQSITGSGIKAVEQLNNERSGITGAMAYPYPIDKNCLPHCDVFLENDYTKEEMKVVNETHKILDSSIRVTCTAVRVPVEGGHSESVNLELAKPFELNAVKALLSQQKGLVVQDSPKDSIYPMPRFVAGKEEVFIGRLRRDTSHEQGLNMWVVADNLRKGAATNTIQIAEWLLAQKLI
ncbi:MAG: aspartate-semialdehyde dehydrogenase [Bacteroidales bacterium]